jgi:hypothetical protein
MFVHSFPHRANHSTLNSESLGPVEEISKAQTLLRRKVFVNRLCGNRLSFSKPLPDLAFPVPSQQRPVSIDPRWPRRSTVRTSSLIPASDPSNLAFYTLAKRATPGALGYRANFCIRDIGTRLVLRRSQVQLVSNLKTQLFAPVLLVCFRPAATNRLSYLLRRFVGPPQLQSCS